MLLLPTTKLPEGPNWAYEVKLDGYRALGIKSNGRVQLRSKNNKDFSRKYMPVAAALAGLPDETVVDGEIVALESGRPSFSSLQNYRSPNMPIIYYIFDVLVVSGRDVTAERLVKRRDLLRSRILPKLEHPVHECAQFNASLSDVIDAVRAQGLEGVVAKNLDSTYEVGRRSGAWRKMRINKGQEFVIGGYTVGQRNFDAVIFGYYEGAGLVYAGRTRNGFTPGSREHLYKRFRNLQISECPFANLPEKRSGRWGLGLTAEKMNECRWLQPELVGQFEFVEWTADSHLRHSRFVALREDVAPNKVRREN
jgi:DNA ligase D-like protein (predicted ligase)